MMDSPKLVYAFLTVLATVQLFEGFIKADVDLSTLNAISDVRLPDEIVPLNYGLYIEPKMENENFTGLVKISLKWIKDTKKVHFHAYTNLLIDVKKIKLSRLNLENKTTVESLTVLKGGRLPRKDIFVLYLKDYVKKDSEYFLEIPFEGNILEAEEGLFKGYYTNLSKNGQEVYLATNLKPTYARRVFPCFDEPGIKVPFNVSIARPQEYTTLFNTRLHHTIQHPVIHGYWLDYFYNTPPISTCAFGFVISKLEMWNQAKMLQSHSTPTFYIWNNNLPSVILLDVQNKLTTAYKAINKYLNTPLSTAKVDVIAIPDLNTVRFASTYGILIVRESELLKTGVFAMCRELVYQWIGIWITPDWWTDNIVNKALANYIASEIMLDINDGVEFNGKYPMTILYSLYYELSKRYPHSRLTGMKHESRFSKIELIVRMLRLALGERTFKIGIHRFISDFKSKAYKASDLWNTLSKQAIEDEVLDSSFSILDIVESWLNLDRLPLITINRDYNSGTASVQQKVYLRERPHDVPNQDKMLWWIPIALARQDTLNFAKYCPCIWMNKTKELQISNMPIKNMFIIANPEEIGPFPVNYDQQNWNMLSIYLRTEDKREHIPIYTRAKLLHDAWNLAYAGELNFATALNMTLFLRHERSHIVWNPVFPFLDLLGRRLDMSPLHRKFELYIIELLVPLYENLGHENVNEDIWKTDMRKLTKTFLCRAGYFPCLRAAQNAFKVWVNSSNPNFEIPVPFEYICPVFKWGSMNDWMFGLERINQFPKLRLQSERTFLLKMLAGCPRQREKINYILDLAILKNISLFTDSDKILIINMVTMQSIGYTSLLDFLSTNWDYVHQKFQNKTTLWIKLITSATGKFSTQDGYDMAKNFYDKYNGQFGIAKHLVETSLRNIKEEVHWSEQNLPVIEEWIDNFLADTQ
ncbi:glutamyl aminopeptidase isoform X3 [Drosophila biarmipes]|uniref:glutamyl aminopeptidase isoform X3 n=1 Tax=Drosophila biarmipes TaxID=125945 RepID=UPI0021CD18C6|nr:glutamyl aminopeptidase isoform X3 [Drosophila biarmipes]XP_050746093.1 glutamyl aminopeptidase isoform X3 [Drosophila biarmipes]XP_050746094.1 glutamyl aminopeptidase isoform X3 [Drosophila biarmipes]XP_050746095.1 glutamyl aminopeptidase isoform X3 [Drosophila biarmipes]XP_050746096.1 glutamyl aminopeptidase isoform X3 [Drosophila biarmipes]